SFGRKMLHDACRLVAFALAFTIPVAASAEAIPRGAAAKNIKAVGYSDLQGRPGFKMSIRQVGDRWYLYMGHLWHYGWSIVDVTGTHRNFYAGGKYMHLAAGMPGYKDNIYVIVDISDPANPVEAGRWWVPGQKEGEAAVAPQSTSLHGPPEVVGNTVFLPYGGAGMIILDINDVSKPKEIGRLSYSPPFLSFIGVHTVVPAPEKKLAYVNSEAIFDDCKEALNHASIVDISDLTKPRMISLLPLPVPPATWKIKSFCEHGGRF